MIELIQQHTLMAAQAGNWSQVAATLNALTTTVSDSQPWTYGKIGERLGVPAQMAAADFLRPLAASNGRLQDAHQLLLLGDGTKTGLRLDLDDRQQELAALSQAFPAAAGLLNSIAALGRSPRSLLQTPVTADQCQSAWNAHLDAQTIAPRIVNASALASERIRHSDTPEVQAQKWAQAWLDGV